MKIKALSAVMICGTLVCATRPAYGVSREIIRMMQQLDTLTQQVQNMQKSIDTQSAVLRTLVEQVNDNVNSMKASVADAQKNSGKSVASSNARFDTLTSQIQALSESLDEAKARIAKLSDQVAQTQNIIQTLNTPPPAGDATAGQPGAPANAPDPDTLYKSGLSYLSGGQYDLALQAFQDYLKYFGNTDLASNAQFYIGEVYYVQKNYSQAIEEYNKCLERYPSGNKLPAAQLKKAYALQELGQKTAAERELKSLITRFAGSHEADLAQQRLKKLRGR